VILPLVPGVIGVVCGWRAWLGATNGATVPVWRRVIGSLGLLGVTAQIVLLIWISIYTSGPLYDSPSAIWWFPAELFLSIAVVVCVLVGKWPNRWWGWILTSSICLFVWSFISICDV
jgi:hypothetical protein